jgi:ABC-type branched-subunit amino acid transport system substrate-binding protein
MAADPAQGEAQLRAFLAAWPAGALADDALLRLAERALARDDEAAARAHLDALLRQHPTGDRSDAARVELARLELARGDGDAAAAAMGRVRLSRLSQPERREAYGVLARVARDPVARLRWLARLRAELHDPEEIAAVDARIDAVVLELDARSLERAAGQLGDEIPAARALVRAAELALDADEVERARDLVERASALPLAPAYEDALRAVRERLRLHDEGEFDVAELPSLEQLGEVAPADVSRARGTLGVVLPLTGPFARFGEESLEGVLLAAGIFPAGPEGPEVRLRIRDTGGRPERAAEVVRELAAAGDVAAIVGPLLSGECEAAAAEAQAAGLPLLALSSREEIARDRPFVFRVRTTPHDEVRMLVDYATRVLGAQSFAILYPRDVYGRGLRRLFWDEVEAAGGQVVSVASYDPEANDFGDPIRRLVGYVLLTPAEKRLIEKREEMLSRARRLPHDKAIALRDEARAMTGPDDEPLPPIVDFDALFIPESYEKVGLIAPHLAYHEVVGMRLLGASGWHHPQLLELAQQHVEGAVFTAHFFSESPIPFVRGFADAYSATFGAPADVFAAQAYDATRLALAQLARGRSSPEAVRDGLLLTKAWPGVTGVLSMRGDGNAQKRPFVLGVERGHVRQLE